jgi:hypothetical protein
MSTLSEPKEGLEQIREIVVGAFEREVERRLMRLEAEVSARGSDLPQEARRRMDVIEAHLRKETEALAGRVETETTDTREALRTLGREQRESTTALEQRLTKLEELVAKQHHGLRQEILDQAKLFLDELQGLRTELKETVERELTMSAELGEEPRRNELREVGENASP